MRQTTQGVPGRFPNSSVAEGERLALVVEDQTTYREMLAELLEVSGAATRVLTAANGEEAEETVTRDHPDLVILDVVLPDAHGIDLLERWQKRRRRPKVVVLTGHSRPEVVRAAVRAGAHGVVMKDAPLSDLREAIERVRHGGVYYCPETSRILHEVARDPERGLPLTKRQKEILREVARGLSTKEIADRLELSEKTVSNHRTRLMQRLGIHDVAGLTRYAVAHGLVSV